MKQMGTQVQHFAVAMQALDAAGRTSQTGLSVPGEPQRLFDHLVAALRGSRQGVDSCPSTPGLPTWRRLVRSLLRWAISCLNAAPASGCSRATDHSQLDKLRPHAALHQVRVARHKASPGRFLHLQAAGRGATVGFSALRGVASRDLTTAHQARITSPVRAVRRRKVSARRSICSAESAFSAEARGGGGSRWLHWRPQRYLGDL